MVGCGKCGAKLPIIANQVGRRDVCPQCGSELHSCVHCRHFDENVAKECKEPFAEVPSDKESANFCELFQIGDGQDRGGMKSKDDLFSAAESLFKKK
jgi:hypothetical protein